MRNSRRYFRAIVSLLSIFSLGNLQPLSAQEPESAKNKPSAAVAAEPQVASQSVSSPREVVPAFPVPRLIKFSGAATDSSGRLRTGTVGITFAIYKDQEGGAALWLETQNAELDAQGRYSVLLGSSKSEGVPLDLFATGEPRWLGVQVQLPGEVEQPRVLLVSVPYALKAADAETLGGKPASAFVLVPGAGTGVTGSFTAGAGSAISPAATCPTPPCAVVTNGGTANQVVKFSDATTVGNSAIYENAGQVGIGNTNPGRTLDVSGEIAVRGGNIFMQRNLTDQAGRRNWAWGTETFNVGDVSLFVSTTNTAFPSVPVFTALSNSNMGVGVGTPSQKLEVAGNVKISGTGNALIFPDGSVMSSAATGVGGGTITGVTAGAGLSGGGTTGGVALSNTGVLSFNGRAGLVSPSTSDYSFAQISGAATTAQLPAASLVRAITYLAGCDSCSVLTNADSQNVIFENLIGTMTINSVTCFSDGGSPAINIQVNHGGSLSNVLSSNLTCSTSGASSTSFSTSALSVNDILNFTLVADGVAKRVTTIIKATVN